MRAYVLKHYGGPEGSLLMDVPAPTPRPRDILVEVRAAGLNPVDFKFRRGKLRAILRPKLPLVLGNELAGEVIAVGSHVSRFRVGDRVFARVAKDRASAFAEQACVDEDHAAHTRTRQRIGDVLHASVRGRTMCQAASTKRTRLVQPKATRLLRLPAARDLADVLCPMHARAIAS
jgi:NADPH:quinone reductase-like Zn-dependent oxidoreductase